MLLKKDSRRLYDEYDKLYVLMKITNDKLKKAVNEAPDIMRSKEFIESAYRLVVVFENVAADEAEAVEIEKRMKEVLIVLCEQYKAALEWDESVRGAFESAISTERKTLRFLTLEMNHRLWLLGTERRHIEACWNSELFMIIKDAWSYISSCDESLRLVYVLLSHTLRKTELEGMSFFYMQRGTRELINMLFLLNQGCAEE